MDATPSKNYFWTELAKLILLSIVIVIPFRLYIAQPFIVDGTSMDPTFKNGNYLIVDELSYHFNTPERGSVLVFKYPRDPSKKFIKRVIGLPGETVSIKNGTITIINPEHPEGFLLDEPYVKFAKLDTVDYIVGDKEYFVMGDNRAASSDSRIWGTVPVANLIGRPIVRFWLPGILPGQTTYDTEKVNNTP